MIQDLTLGRLGIADGVFLGKEELTRQQLFLLDKLRFLASLGGSGFVGSDSFLITAGTIGSGTINVPYSLVIDKNGQLIYKESQQGLSIPEGSFWLVARFIETPLEKGICSVSAVGGVYTLNGVGTEFTKIFRGVSTQYKPTKVEFSKVDLSEPNNINQYTVLEVVSDTQLLLSDPVYDDVNLKVKVINTFSQDLIPSTDDRFLYKNCGCELILVPELVVGQKPSLSSYGVDGETVFPIASISNSSGVLTIFDRRETFYTKLDEFVSVGTWSVLSLNTGFIQDPTNPMSVRFNHFKNQLEIKGKFTTAYTTGSIVQLDSEYYPENPQIIRLIKEGDSSEILLLLTTDGQLELFKNSSTFDNTGFGNSIYNQIVTLS